MRKICKQYNSSLYNYDREPLPKISSKDFHITVKDRSLKDSYIKNVKLNNRKLCFGMIKKYDINFFPNDTQIYREYNRKVVEYKRCFNLLKSIYFKHYRKKTLDNTFVNKSFNHKAKAYHRIELRSTKDKQKEISTDNTSLMRLAKICLESPLFNLITKSMESREQHKAKINVLLMNKHKDNFKVF